MAVTSTVIDQGAATWLDRPVWSAMASHHRCFAQIRGRAGRLHPDIGPFAATARDDTQSLDALTQLVVASASGVTLMQACEITLPAGLHVRGAVEGVQMLLEGNIAPGGQDGIVRLGRADIPQMLALTKLTEPGPFVQNTHLLGRYWGIRKDGRLVAMAGERLRQPSFTEISAVCVHPDHRGKGYGARLTAVVAAAIEDHGDRPYLHAVADNVQAIRLYESLGFRIRCPVQVAWLEPPSGPRDAKPTQYQGVAA